jgi:signal transduction histidine kinase
MNARRTPARPHLLGLIWPFVAVVLAQAILASVSLYTMSAVRAYVGGESLWSKARASAVGHLRSHALTGRAVEYRRFLEALTVPLGDRSARLELDKPDPDLDVVRAGLLAGENVAGDIPGLIRLYRWFRHVEFMDEAVRAWTEGDRLIEQLQALGLRIHLHVERGDPPAVLQPLLDDLDALDARFVTVEKYFSATLGRASRETERLLVGVTVVLGALLGLGGGWFVRRAMRLQMIDRQLLIEANHRWELAAEAAGIGLFDWHIAEDRFQMDERACRLYGLKSGPEGAGFKRSEMRAMTHPDDQAFVRLRLDEAVNEGTLFRNRYRVRLPDGDIRHLEGIGRVRQGRSPDDARMYGILRDVGGEVAQAQLTIDKEAAERMARLRVEFLSRLSHELRTPLNAVLGVAQLLSIDPAEPLSPNQAKRVKILQDSGAQLLRLIEDVLDITRIDSGALQLVHEPVDLLATVRAGLDVVEPERAAREIRIEDRMPHRVLEVLADGARLQQVFVNLLGNACKYNSRGGRLSLTSGEDEQRAWVQVRDDGPGMTPEQLAMLFQPFRRFAPTPDSGGAGLGLVVSKLLVDQMQGSISVDSEPGKGTSFTVSLKRA